jgi:hypothetical protein
VSAKAEAVLEELRSDFERYMAETLPFGAVVAVVNDANEALGMETLCPRLEVSQAVALPDGSYAYLCRVALSDDVEEPLGLLLTDPLEQVGRFTWRAPLLDAEGLPTDRWLLIHTDLPDDKQRRLENLT